MKRFRILLLVLALAAVTGLLWFAGEKQRQEEERRAAQSSVPEAQQVYTNEDFVMDTFITQTIYGDKGEEAIRQVAACLREIEAAYSAYLPDSEIAKVNAQAGIRPAEVSPEVFSVIRRGLEFSQETEGVFDITIGPLVRLWGITGENPKVPAANAISSALNAVGHGQVVLDEEAKTVSLPRPGISLDLGALVKGYAAQKVWAIYQELGVDGAAASLGGTIVVYGEKPGGEPFAVGLRDPEGDAADYYGILRGEERLLATSGGYERYFEEDGQVYHHVLDPRTGFPAETDLLSVTVACDDGLKADFLSTWLYMEGTQGVTVHLNQADYSIAAVDRDHNVYLSDDLKEKFTLEEGKGYQLAP